MRIGLILGFMIVTGAAAAFGASAKPLEVVPRVDLQRYLGTWYEIATIPQRFQKGCVGVTAHYSLRADGAIDVVNGSTLPARDKPYKISKK
ncbi:MAG: lipocalin family protein [Candidatus Aminicenantales bacterium]